MNWDVVVAAERHLITPRYNQHILIFKTSTDALFFIMKRADTNSESEVAVSTGVIVSFQNLQSRHGRIYILKCAASKHSSNTLTKEEVDTRSRHKLFVKHYGLVICGALGRALEIIGK